MEVVFIETWVSRMNLKSIIARVIRRPTENGLVRTKAHGAVWSDGTEIKRVEVKVDDGKLQPAQLHDVPHSKYCCFNENCFNSGSMVRSAFDVRERS